MTNYCDEQYIHSLEKSLEEKDKMIDWLAEICSDFCNNHYYCNDCIHYPSGCPILSQIKYRFQKYVVSDWRKAAQEEVKKNENTR